MHNRTASWAIFAFASALGTLAGCRHESSTAARPGDTPRFPAPAGLARPLLQSGGVSRQTLVHAKDAARAQSEAAIAANADGSILIAGYFDPRGLGASPFSISGVARSQDGGQRWAEVPVGPGGAGVLPPGAGDLRGQPDIKYDWLRDRFVYASVYRRSSDGLFGIALHVSNSGATAGTTWTGPTQVGPTFAANTAGDKPFLDIHPITGRLFLSYTQVSPPSTPTTYRIMTTYSDDSGQTWAPATVLVSAAATAVQASVPRVLPRTSNSDAVVYVVWRMRDPATELRNIGCSRSLDGGATWEAPVLLDAQSFAAEDQILGVDRINVSPDMAVDPDTGQVYVVYQRNNAQGTGDIALRRFTGACAPGTPVLLSRDPGSDRAQFYPFIAIDPGPGPSRGRVHVGYYDQGVAPTGDWLEVMHTLSADQGATWSPPVPLSDRPFHAGYGNDTGQPNLGDYNQGVARNGRFFGAFAATAQAPRFDEGLPDTRLVSPDVYVASALDSERRAPLQLAGVSTSDSAFCGAAADGNASPGETIDLTLTLENNVVNPSTGATPLRNVTATLESATAGVTVVTATATYPDLAPGMRSAAATPFRVRLARNLVPGTQAELVLTASSDQGEARLPVTLALGADAAAAQRTELLFEDFNNAPPDAPPDGWQSVIGGTGLDIPHWFVGTVLFKDTPAITYSEDVLEAWTRLFSPLFTVPGGVNQGHVTIDFDLISDLQDDPIKAVEARDGLTLRLADWTGQTGVPLREVLVEAFAEQIRTGSSDHFPKHLIRMTSPNYFEDQSVWSGDSGGPVHVSIRLPAAGMAGRTLQLRFEYTQDDSIICSDVRGVARPCGVAMDNVRVAYVPVVASPCAADPAVSVQKTVAGNYVVGGAVTYTLVLQNNGSSTQSSAVLRDQLPESLHLVDAAATGGTVTPDLLSNRILWSGALAAGATVTVTVNATILPSGLNQQVCNQAELDLDQAGDGAVDQTVLSDDPSVPGPADPTAFTVVAAICGNGQLEAGEACDDGNQQNGDCCSSSCSFEPMTVVCRAKSGPCDVAEQCDGAGRCPADGRASDGTSCANGDLCDGAEVCQSGACTSGPPLVCDDQNPKTQDRCDPTAGCQFEKSGCQCALGSAAARSSDRLGWLACAALAGLLFWRRFTHNAGRRRMR